MIGKILAHYHIVEKIGEGGMGVVYRATDSKLGRDVAIKVLPDDVARDPERLARFEREAQLLASLNHPHVAGIHQLEESKGIRFLALELVPGETLAKHLARGPLPVKEALEICGQIAEALEAAHEKGIVHRDLKPGNVKVTPEGVVKVLDFGLAKVFAADSWAADLSHSPTVSIAGTREGVILGTAAYMSPEQARGKPLDKRTDIWSFGCVLYETLTGNRAIKGETSSDTIAAILEREPDWAALPADTPNAIRNLLRRCLQKDPGRRLHDIADARIEIEEVLTRSGGEAASEVRGQASSADWQRYLPWALAVIAVGAAFLGWSLLRVPLRSSPQAIHFQISAPHGQRINTQNWHQMEISYDGSRIVFVAGAGERGPLYVRSLNQFEALPVAGPKRAYNPFFSPDGKWLAYTEDGKLKKVPLEQAEAPSVLCDAAWGGGTWGVDGTIIFTPAYTSGLARIPEGGGTPQELTKPDHAKGELGHWWPQFLPESEWVLFTVFSSPLEKSRIAAYSLRTGERRTLVEGAVFGRYVNSGHLLFVRYETLLAVPFDLKTLQVTGSPVPVLGDVSSFFSNGVAQLSVSANGTLVFVTASSVAAGRTLVMVDRRGGRKTIGENRGPLWSPQFSPDGTRLAVTLGEEGQARIWLHDFERGTWTRLSFGPSTDFGPVWTPDGRRVIFVSERPVFHIYWKTVDSSQPEEPLLATEHDSHPSSVSPDGKLLLFTRQQDPKTQGDIWVLPLGGERTPQVFLRTPYEEHAAVFSPDGRWVAYQSDESGRSEIYVQAFPATGSRWQVSTDGGSDPVWARSGRELFYRNGNKFMSAVVQASKTFHAGKPVPLFEDTFDESVFSGFRSGFDVSPDGQRFVFPKEDPRLREEVKANVVLNWFEELKRRVPSGRK